MPDFSVAVVIPCFNQKRFLRRALDSLAGQTRAADEIIVVDDGSTEPLADVTDQYQARLIRQKNRGRSGAKNAGLQAAKSDRVIFLDADDRLLPNALAAGLSCFDRHPEAAFVYGGYVVVTRKRRETEFKPVRCHRDLVMTNWIGMIAAVMFDREKLVSCGGFDETLDMCEDWDVFLRLSRKYSFASHPEIVADYVRHDANATRDIRELRRWIAAVRSKEWERGLDIGGQEAWREGEAIWRQRVPDPVRRSLFERLARKAARAVLRPLGS
jgi:glycosyltransferase involved in cell wall biosynthesis